MVRMLRTSGICRGVPEKNPGKDPLVTLVLEFSIAPAREDLQSS